MERDHDVIDYQYEIEHPEIRYDDPHLHAPLSEISDHDPIIDERRPSDEDFYNFQSPQGKSVLEYQGQEQ